MYGQCDSEESIRYLPSKLGEAGFETPHFCPSHMYVCIRPVPPHGLTRHLRCVVLK